jgi:hypothetical protein
MKLEKKMINPASVLIEQTAADLCAEYYEIGRSQGLTSKSKTHKQFVHRNIEHFIPIAIDILTTILGNPSTPQSQKDLILEALLERANDPDLIAFNEPIPIFKEAPNNPVIINTKSLSSLLERK